MIEVAQTPSQTALHHALDTVGINSCKRSHKVLQPLLPSRFPLTAKSPSFNHTLL